MGILGRFSRREARDRIGLKHHLHPVKHKFASRTKNASTSPSLPQKRKSQFSKITSTLVKDSKNLLDNMNSRLGPVIQVDHATATAIRNEVMDLLNSSSDHSCTTLEMANALNQSQACIESHSKINEKHFAKTFLSKLLQNRKSRSTIFPRKIEKESMKSRYQWMDALNRLEKSPSSRDQTVSTWEEAKKSLEKVIVFPTEEKGHDQAMESSQMQLLTNIKNENRENLEAEIEIVQENVNALSFSSVKWKQIEMFPIQNQFNDKLKDGKEEDLEVLKQKVSNVKADLYFNARIRTAEELANQLRKSEAVRELEERKLKDEARKRAASLMRALTDEERKIVDASIHGFGHGDEIIAQAGTDSVQRASMQTLKPGMWLNDEVIHYFYLMLAKRDEELCQNDPSRKRSHFFKSFFITKLLNEGNASCDGKYEYRNVKRWSKKVPGKDIFNLDKILFPINMGNMHWICAAIFMKTKRIEIFDSMGSNGNRYLDALFNYIQDEHMDKKKTPLPDADSWQLVPTQRDTPRQRNGTCVFEFRCVNSVMGESSINVLM